MTQQVASVVSQVGSSSEEFATVTAIKYLSNMTLLEASVSCVPTTVIVALDLSAHPVYLLLL